MQVDFTYGITISKWFTGDLGYKGNRPGIHGKNSSASKLDQAHVLVLISQSSFILFPHPSIYKNCRQKTLSKNSGLKKKKIKKGLK